MSYADEEAKKQHSREYYQRNKERIKRNVKAYRAKNHEECKARQRRYNEKNREQIRADQLEYRIKNKDNPRFIRSRQQARLNYRASLRNQVLEAYGGKCTCCGETEPEFLTVEHVGGWGAKHRREAGSRARGDMLYKSIIEAGFPKEFSVLCMQCNFATRGGRICPHQRIDMQSVLRGMAC